MQAHINLAENGLFLFENVPPGTEVGIDYHSWHVGPKFRGISNIPPGFHFIFFSSVDKHKQYSPRTGFFIFIKPSDVIFRIYGKESEDFVNENLIVEDCLQSKYTKYLFVLFKDVFTQPASTCSKLTIKTPEQRQWRLLVSLFVKFKHISHLFKCFYC